MTYDQFITAIATEALNELGLAHHNPAQWDIATQATRQAYEEANSFDYNTIEDDLFFHWFFTLLNQIKNTLEPEPMDN